MKKLLLFCCLAAGTLLFSGCGNKNNEPTPLPVTYDDAFTINGGAFKNKTINFKTITSSAGSYSTSNKVTTVDVVATNEDTISIHLNLTFTGNKTGSFTVLQDPANFVLISTAYKSTGTGDDFSADANSVIAITKYDAVGGSIEGTFNGTYNSAGVEYTITGAKFSVKRAADTL